MNDGGPYVTIHLFQRILLEQRRSADHAHGFINHLYTAFHDKLKTRDQAYEVILAARRNVIMRGDGLMLSLIHI